MLIHLWYLILDVAMSRRARRRPAVPTSFPRAAALKLPRPPFWQSRSRVPVPEEDLMPAPSRCAPGVEPPPPVWTAGASTRRRFSHPPASAPQPPPTTRPLMATSEMAAWWSDEADGPEPRTGRPTPPSERRQRHPVRSFLEGSRNRSGSHPSRRHPARPRRKARAGDRPYVLAPVVVGHSSSKSVANRNPIGDDPECRALRVQGRQLQEETRSCTVMCRGMLPELDAQPCWRRASGQMRARPAAIHRRPAFEG